MPRFMHLKLFTGHTAGFELNPKGEPIGPPPDRLSEDAKARFEKRAFLIQMPSPPRHLCMGCIAWPKLISPARRAFMY